MSSTPPTRAFLGIHTALDALTLFEAVRSGRLPLIRQRLSQSARDNLNVGQVFVWAESSAADGLERWTDGRKWSPSKSRDVFLIYEERDEPSAEEKVEKAAQRINKFFSSSSPTQDGDSDLVGIFAVPNFRERPAKRGGLVKQTFSAWVRDPVTGLREKWHMSAYLSTSGWANLPVVADDAVLRNIRLPVNIFECCTGPRKQRRLPAAGPRKRRSSAARSDSDGSMQQSQRPSLRLEWTSPMVPSIPSSSSLSSETSLESQDSPSVSPSDDYLPTSPWQGQAYHYSAPPSPSIIYHPMAELTIQPSASPRLSPPSPSSASRTSGKRVPYPTSYPRQLPSLSDLPKASKNSSRTDLDARTLLAFRPSL